MPEDLADKIAEAMGLLPPGTTGAPAAAAPAQPEPAGDSIQLWIKTNKGTIPVTAEGLSTTVAQIRAKVAAECGVDVSCCRLIFAGKELEVIHKHQILSLGGRLRCLRCSDDLKECSRGQDTLSLADYNCADASELNLILRVSGVEAAAEADSSVDADAEQQTAAIRAHMAGKKLADFNVQQKIGNPHESLWGALLGWSQGMFVHGQAAKTSTRPRAPGTRRAACAPTSTSRCSAAARRCSSPSRFVLHPSCSLFSLWLLLLCI